MKIEIDGIEYGFLWGLHAFKDYADDMGVSKVDEVYLHILDSIENQYKLYYFAVLNYVKNKDETAELPFTFRKFVNVLESQSLEVHEGIMKSFRNSMFSGKTMDEHYAYLNELMSIASGDVSGDASVGEDGGDGNDKKKEAQK